jgi:hypothetical protein
MIRFIHCIKAVPGLSDTEFRRLFRSGQMQSLWGRLADITGALDFHASLTLQIELNNEMMRERNSAEPFDALIEVRWDNGQQLMKKLEDESAQALLAEIEDHNRTFIDYSRSTRFFVED